VQHGVAVVARVVDFSQGQSQLLTVRIEINIKKIIIKAFIIFLKKYFLVVKNNYF
jgi:hypothetical protein